MKPGKEPRQLLNAAPAFASLDTFDPEVFEVTVEHIGTLLGERRCAVVLFLPYGDTATLPARAF